MQVDWRQLVRLHDKFKSWKPIHLCWWFEKRGLPIPPYLIGGAPVTHQRYFAFGDDSGDADPDNQTWDTENANRIDVVKEIPFFLRFAVSEEDGGTEGNKYAELYYNTTNDVSTSIQVTTSSSVVRLVDDPGGNITDGDPTDDSSVLTTTGSYASGYYHDASDNSVKHSLDPNTTRDYQFCLQFQSDALDSQIHYFWIRWQTPTSLDNYEAVPTATTAAGVVYKYLAGQSDVVISTTASLSRKRSIDGQSNVAISTTCSLSVKKELVGQSNVKIETGILQKKREYTYAAGEFLPHAILILGNYIYVGLLTAPAKLLKINVNDISDYSVLTFASDGIHDGVMQLRYSTSKAKIYALFSETRVVLSEVTPSDLSATDVINDTSYNCGQGSFCLDESFVYVVCKAAGKLVKYSMTTWLETDNANTQSDPHAIEYESGNVYFTHAASPGRVSKADIATLTVSTQQFAAGDNIATDDFAIVGDFLYVGLEALNGRIPRITKSDLSIWAIGTGRSTSCYAVQYDGTYIWAAYTGTPGYLIRINPSTYIVDTYSFGNNKLNEIAFYSNSQFITTYENPFVLVETGISVLLSVKKEIAGQSNVVISTTADLTVTVGAVSLAGQSDISVSTTASLSVTKELAGQSNIAVSTTASLSVIKELVGQSNIVISTTGVLSRKKTLQGQSNIGVSTTCSLSRKRGVVGQSNIAISTISVLQRKRTLVGQSNVVISSTGSLSRKRTIVGQSNIQISTTCDLSITGVISLQGQSNIQISSTASLSVKKEISGQSNIQISTTCDLSITGVISLQSQSDVVISTTASLSVKKELVVQSNIVVSSTASLSRKRSLSGRSDIVFLREEKVVNGNFASWPGDNPAGWTVAGESPPNQEISEVAAGEAHADAPTIGGGFCNLYTIDGTNVQIHQTILMTSGRKHRVSINVDTVTVGGITISGLPGGVETYTTTGIKTFTFTSIGNDTVIIKRSPGAGEDDVTFDDVSVREMLSAPLSVKRNISGQSNISLSTTASLSVKRSLIGASAISITTAASLNRQRSLIGASVISVSTTGLLGLKFNLVGQSNIVITSTGTLSATKQLIGTTNIVTSLTARMIVGWSLSGASAIRISTSGALSDRVKPAWLISRNVAPLNSIMSRI